MTKIHPEVLAGRAAALTDHELATGIATARQTLACRRTQGAFLDRACAAGDHTWTYATVTSTVRAVLRTYSAERDRRERLRAGRFVTA